MSAKQTPLNLLTISTFLKLGHSAIGGQMHSIGFTKLVHVNTELYFEPVTPFHPFHGYSDYACEKVLIPKASILVVQGDIMGLF